MPKAKAVPAQAAVNPLEDLKGLVGKRLVCESKKPGRDIVDVDITVSNVIQIPDQATYLFGVAANGTTGITNTKFFFEDTVQVALAVDFKAQPLDGWYLCPAEDGKFSNHFAYAEKVSERAKKRLPKGSVELATYAIA